MSKLIKPISLFFICFSLFITNCSENSNNSNPIGPGDQFTNPTKEVKHTILIHLKAIIPELAGLMMDLLLN
jgi:hypothetical protein